MPQMFRWFCAIAFSGLLCCPVVAVGPVIPGVTKILSIEEPNLALAGRILIGELQCLRCHQTPGANDWISSKEAPKLDQAKARLKPEWIQGFLENPGVHKTGTTMPNMLGHLEPTERKTTAEALTHFLATQGPAPTVQRFSSKLIQTGQTLYAQVGCASCHGPRNGAAIEQKEIPNQIPLGKLEEKYHYAALVQFLANPHSVRPSGRMPALLQGNEADAVASYLLQNDTNLTGSLSLNTLFFAYEGDWDKLPDFEKIKPVRTGKSAGFDLTVATRQNSVALLFTGFWEVKRAGTYRFSLASDDGSRLKINNKTVINNDGIHPLTMVQGAMDLTVGVHQVEVSIFQGGGEFELSSEVSGPGLPKSDLGSMLRPTLTPVPVPVQTHPKGAFVIDHAKATQGKIHYAQLGCVNCHKLDSVKAPVPEITLLKGVGGCIGTIPTKGKPFYPLSENQKKLVQVGLDSIAKSAPTKADKISHTFVALNCVGCHQRDTLGGVEPDRSAFFLGTQPEMGDEARIPPLLTGIGGKLKKPWLKEVMEKGTKVRPYMLTRMPRFGEANIGHLVQDLPEVDKLAPVPLVEFSESENKVKNAAKFLVGGKALGCIKCHTFNGIKAEGVQAIDMVQMSNRLNRDWFITYMKNPSVIRPGTRMPASFPNGKTFFDNLLKGEVNQQMEAVWFYLTLRDKAPVPDGLIRGAIPLIPGKDAIIYRNFLEGVGPRSIGVGYPEKVNLAFDANLGRLAQIWQGSFIDASKHWLDRGAGNQIPLGDNLINLTTGPGVVILQSANEIWPSKPVGYKFLGYSTTPDDRPTFRYQIGGSTIEDFSTGKPEGDTANLIRTISVSSPSPGLTIKIAESNALSGSGEIFQLSKDLTIKIQGAPARIRTVGGKKELVVDLEKSTKDNPLKIEYLW